MSQVFFEATCKLKGEKVLPAPKQLSASVGAAAICGARYWPESTPRAHASSVTLIYLS